LNCFLVPQWLMVLTWWAFIFSILIGKST